MSALFDREQDPRYVRVYKAATPDLLEKFSAFDDAVFAAEGREIPLKYRELMALSVALTTQCGYCIDFHTRAARKAGASDAELAESAWVAAAIRAGGAFSHGRLAFRLAGLDLGAHQH